MQPDRVERIKILLAAALARPPAERDAYLDVACGGDLTLRRDVEQYLFSGDKTEQFVYHPNEVRDTDPGRRLPTDPRLGKEFGKYLIRERLAEGGMGIVYLAIDRQLGREVALKILPEYFSVDKERLQRFHREARATSLLNHPNIVTVFELGQMDGCEFIVTEYVAGETLRQKMECGPVPFVEMLKIGTQVASALGAAHQAGIVHRDIKPENVMIRPDGYVKVLDFGLAKLSDATRKRVSGEVAASQHNRTVPGMVMGTASYMSPEQAEGNEIDARTDIWALGVILYEMAAGKLPFDGPTPSHTIVAILEHEPQPYEHPSAELRQIISTALQKDRQLRFQTAEAMADALEAAKHRLGYISDQNVASLRRPEPEPASAVVVEKPKSRGKLVWLLPVVALVLLIASAGVIGAALLISQFLAAGTTTESENSALPTPESTVQSVAATPEPTLSIATTPVPIYVEPTPTPDVAGTTSVDEDRRVRVQPTRVPVQTEPRRTPAPVRPKPKPSQDPNCVFTNTCH